MHGDDAPPDDVRKGRSLDKLGHDARAALTHVRCALEDVMQDAAFRLGVRIEPRTMTVLSRASASLVVVAHRGSADFVRDINDKVVALVYLDLPARRDGARLSPGFYVLRTLVDPDSGAQQVVFVGEGARVARFPASVRITGTGPPEPGIDADCDVDGNIGEDKACVSAKCCGGAICLEVDVCLTY